MDGDQAIVLLFHGGPVLSKDIAELEINFLNELAHALVEKCSRPSAQFFIAGKLERQFEVLVVRLLLQLVHYGNQARKALRKVLLSGRML